MLRRFVALERSGDLYLYGALAAGTGAAVLAASLRRDDLRRRELASQLDQQLAAARRRARSETLALAKKFEEAETLWSGVLTHANPTLQGHLFLRGSRVGQEVDILEEKAGPRAVYLTVRERTRGTLGLYPASWVERQTASM